MFGTLQSCYCFHLFCFLSVSLKAFVCLLPLLCLSLNLPFPLSPRSPSIPSPIKGHPLTISARTVPSTSRGGTPSIRGSTPAASTSQKRKRNNVNGVAATSRESTPTSTN